MDAATEPTKKCPMCAETILAAAIKCKHCGAVVDEAAAGAAAKAPEMVGVLLLLLPLAAAGFLYFYVPSVRMIDRPLDTMNMIVGITIVLSLILIAVDATMIKQARGKGPALGSAIVLSVLLWIVGLPLYLYERSKFGAKNYAAGGLLGVLALIGVYGWYYWQISEAMDNLQRALQQLQQ